MILSNMLVIITQIHWVKSVRIRSFSDPYFPAFGLNTERYGVSLCIQSKRGKIRTMKASAYYLDESVKAHRTKKILHLVAYI